MSLSDKIVDNVVYPKPLVEVSDLKQAVAELKAKGIITYSPNMKIKTLQIRMSDFNEILGDKLI